MTLDSIYPVEYVGLRLIAEHKQLRIIDLATLMGIHRNTAGILVRRLEIKGMVIPYRTNGLIRNVSLSKNGSKIAHTTGNKKQESPRVGRKQKSVHKPKKSRHNK